jgi:hypothetical protein
MIGTSHTQTSESEHLLVMNVIYWRPLVHLESSVPQMHSKGAFRRLRWCALMSASVEQAGDF